MEIVEFLGKTLAWIFGITGILSNIALILIIIAVRNGASLYFGHHNIEEENDAE